MVLVSKGTYTTLYPVGGVRSQEPWKLTIAEPFHEQGNEPHSLTVEEFEQVCDDGYQNLISRGAECAMNDRTAGNATLLQVVSLNVEFGD